MLIIKTEFYIWCHIIHAYNTTVYELVSLSILLALFKKKIKDPYLASF